MFRSFMRTLTRIDKDGTSAPISEGTLYLQETTIINMYPLIQKIIDNETGADVWNRTKAFFPGDYDPGQYRPKG